MNIGISTACLYPLETEEALKFLGENKIPVTEIFFNSPCELEPEFIKELDRIRKAYGIEIASLHPCGSVGEPYFLFSGYPRRINEACEFYKRYYEAAAWLGAKTVVLHGDSLQGHIPMEEYCQRIIAMNNTANEFGVCVSHENVNRYRMADPENVKTLTKMTNGSIKYTFDIKQTVRHGCDWQSMYEAMRGNIINVHISDNGKNGDCLLPCDGEFDFNALFNRLSADQYDGACLIEVYRYAYDKPSELIDAYRKVLGKR